MTQKSMISFRITDEIKADLERLADADARSLSSYITLVLRRHVEAQKSAADYAASRKSIKAG